MKEKDNKTTGFLEEDKTYKEYFKKLIEKNLSKTKIEEINLTKKNPDK